MTTLILIFGILFGATLISARLNKYNVISGQAMLQNFTVLKALLTAIGIGAVLIYIEVWTGVAGFHIKPFVAGGIILGGLFFGAGMAVLGYCPGTMAVSLGEGSLDALTGIIGGIAGGIFYTLIEPAIKNIAGPNLGDLTLYSFAGNFNHVFVLIFVLIFGFICVYIAFLINKREKDHKRSWFFAGIALALLNSLVFLKSTSNRPVGASTSYPYVGDWLTGLTNNSYFLKIETPGRWELIFLTGAFIAGLVLALVRGEFRFTLIHSNWRKYKGSSKIKRTIWAFAGGFVLILGARLAGGCTSGHILSGGMQLALSSLTFAFVTFLSLIITGAAFYRPLRTTKTSDINDTGMAE